ECRRGDVEVLRIDEVSDRLGRGGQRFQSPIDRCLQFGFNFLFQLIDALVVENSFAQQEHLSARNRVALGVAFTLRLWTVPALIASQNSPSLEVPSPRET